MSNGFERFVRCERGWKIRNSGSHIVVNCPGIQDQECSDGVSIVEAGKSAEITRENLREVVQALGCATCCLVNKAGTGSEL